MALECVSSGHNKGRRVMCCFYRLGLVEQAPFEDGHIMHLATLECEIALKQAALIVCRCVQLKGEFEVVLIAFGMPRMRSKAVNQKVVQKQSIMSPKSVFGKSIHRTDSRRREKHDQFINKYKNRSQECPSLVVWYHCTIPPGNRLTTSSV
uniref:Uncharacterized protein n=1 Tax=Panagrellus redivivus TaxID=6233 RepID=A0A7E5A174_PANRE